MELTKKIVSNVVLFIQVLLVFLLMFENSLQVPPVLQAFGRAHPLLLHLPIGLLLIIALLVFGRKWFQTEQTDNITSFLLYLTALTTSFTALMGFFLSQEGGYLESELLIHKWAGVILSFLCWVLITLYNKPASFRVVISLTVVLLIVTGHFGSMLTHGENFVLAPLQQEKMKERAITDSSTVFAAVIDPIFEAKCYTCHNPHKAKGKLVLTTLEAIAKGGKNGALWKPGDAAQSLLVERLTLPIESKEHMPPKDKAQLTQEEIRFISLWIESGADTRKKLSSLEEEDSLRRLSASIIPLYHQEATVQPKYSFEFASDDKVSGLNIPNRAVFRIASNEPALQADFYLREHYDKKLIEELEAVKDQLVVLNVSNMPVTDDDLRAVARLSKIEKLLLNKTDITGDGLTSLKALNNLRSLSLSGTKVNAAALERITNFKSLQEVFIWNTRVSDQDVDRLAKQFPHISWEKGYVPDENEVLTLNPPLFVNEEPILDAGRKLVLKHGLPETEIRYAVNCEVDSIKSPVYKEPIDIPRYSIIQVKAFKSGWKSSRSAEMVVFKKGFKPDEARLVTNPDPKYAGEGAETLVNNKKGLKDFYRDPAYIGFRNNEMIAEFAFDDTPIINSITISYARNVYAMCMPPEYVEVWSGTYAKNMKLLKRVRPEQPDSWVSTRIEGCIIEIPGSRFKHYKIVAKPLSKLPKFRKEPKQKGWLMMDEIFFN